MSKHIPLTKEERAHLADLLLRLTVEIGGAGGDLSILIEPSRSPRWFLQRIDAHCNAWDFESDSFEQAYQEALAHPTTRPPF